MYYCTFLKVAEPREKRIVELEMTVGTLRTFSNEQATCIEKFEEQIEKMKKYGKLLQDICVVLGNDNFMVAVQLESVVKKLWDASEEKEGLKMVEDIEKRLLEIKPQEWAEINEWEM